MAKKQSKPEYDIVSEIQADPDPVATIAVEPELKDWPAPDDLPRAASLEERRVDMVADAMKSFTPTEAAVVNRILHHGRTDRLALATEFTHAVADAATTKAIRANLIDWESTTYVYSVNPTFAPALHAWFDRHAK